MERKMRPADDDRELEELDRAYSAITGYKPKNTKKSKKKSSRVGILLTICALLTVILCGCLFCLVSLKYGTLFDSMLPMPDVTMAGISMGGMSKAEAKAALQQLGADVYSQNMTLRVMDQTLELSPVEAGLQPDWDKAVEDAYRGGSTGDFYLLPYLNLDLNAVRDAVDTLGQQFNSDLKETTVRLEGERPSLEAGTPEEEGQLLVITIGIPEYGLDTTALYNQVLEAYNKGILSVTGDFSHMAPQLPDLDTIYNQSYIAPVDAVMDPVTFEITPERYGYHFDLESAKAILANAQFGETLQFAFTKIPAEVTGEVLAATLYCDVLGSAKTPYYGDDNNNRNTNLGLACEAIDGVVLLPGESFSYNDTLGERTAAKGYKAAPSYEGGLTVDTLGGGICQVSSTLYYSTLFADLEIVERWNHGYVSSYMDPGMDATVSWGGADFCFANNTDYPIRIKAWRTDGYVNVEIYGTDTRDYYIKMDYYVVETIPYDTVYQEMAPDNEKGYKDGDVIITPYEGAIVRTYKLKYNKVTGELISREVETNNTYKKRDKVICRIVENPTDPTVPADPTDPTE